MEQALRQAEKFGAPVIVHAITQKGRGFTLAEEDTEDQFHAVGQIDPLTGKSLETKSGPSWTSVFSDEIVSIADKNENIVGITGAMLIPVGLKKFADKYPSRVFDVGIAEQHAVTSSAGLAFGGLHPVVAIYATFMNRALDQVLMDVALHNAGVTFVLDRAGVTGPDGASHHGMWDLALLQIVPGIEIAAPRDAVTLREELREAVAINDRPTVLRFPKGSAPDEIPSVRRLPDGVDVLSEAPSKDVLIVSVGAMAPVALKVADLLAAQGIGATVIDPRWVVPVRESVLVLASKHRLVVTLEDGVRVGGIGTRIRQDLRAAQIDTALNELGLPDEFLEHASRSEILERVGLTAQSIAQEIVAQVVGARVPHAKPIEEITPQSSQQQL
jgi:1-deoxy-D-xylulose-5-phosphate synthase